MCKELFGNCQIFFEIFLVYVMICFYLVEKYIYFVYFLKVCKDYLRQFVFFVYLQFDNKEILECEKILNQVYLRILREFLDYVVVLLLIY